MKKMWCHNYTKMTSLYYNLARKFEIPLTYISHLFWLKLDGYYLRQVVKKEMFFYFFKGINTAFNEPNIYNS